MRKLKIGIFLDNFFPKIDGVVLVVDNLAKELSKYNDVVVVVPMTSSINDDINRPYKIMRIDSFSIPFSGYKLAFYKSKFSVTYNRLKRQKFDIIHIHSPFVIGKLGLRLAKDLGIPCIATMHTRFDFEVRKIIDNNMIVDNFIKEIIKVYNRCDKCIAVNQAMIKVFKDYGYLYQPVVIYNGTDLKPSKESAIKEVNLKYHLDVDELVFLFVGRITSIKNIFFILDALKLLRADGIKFKMLYVGDGPDFKALKEKVAKYKMTDDVILTGSITDRNELSAIYKRADLFLFPSLFDASSLVQIEAAVNETAGLFIEGSVTADTVIDNVSGYTAKNDVTDYKERIKEIIASREDLKMVSKNAHLMLGKSWDKIALETYTLYLDLLDKQS